MDKIIKSSRQSLLYLQNLLEIEDHFLNSESCPKLLKCFFKVLLIPSIFITDLKKEVIIEKFHRFFCLFFVWRSYTFCVRSTG